MSSIEWTTETWNPTLGCSRVSPGCEHCYAERIAHRGLTADHRGLTRSTRRGPVWTGEVRLLPHRLDQPLRWRKPRRVFVDSMSDLFHPDVPFLFIASVFGVMCYAREHTFQVLTKRPERALEFMEWIEKSDSIALGKDGKITDRVSAAQRCLLAASYVAKGPVNGPLFGIRFLSHIKPNPGAAIETHWPLPNVWLGVSAENQETLDERVPLLLQTPASVRFVSAEPLLERVDLSQFLTLSHRSRRSSSLWLICGGESGPGARPCDVEWIRSIVAQCRDAKVPCFVKQLGSRPILDRPQFELDSDTPDSFEHSKGGDPAEWPEDLRVREFPTLEGTP